MMKELFGFLKEMLNRLFSSRLFALSIVFFLLFSVLTLHLFRLQILHGNDYLQEYQKYQTGFGDSRNQGKYLR